MGILGALVRGAKGKVAKECCLATLGNLCSNKDIADYLISPELGLLQATIENLKNSDDTVVKHRAVRILGNVSNLLHVSNCGIMKNNGAVRLALEIIRDDGGGDPLEWPGGCQYGYISGCIIFLHSICRFREIAIEAKEFGATDILIPLILVPQSVSKDLYIFASFAVAHISGRDEGKAVSCIGSCKSLLEKYPQVISAVVKVLEKTLTGGEHHDFGLFQLNVILSAIVALSISDSNKKLMIESPLLELIIIVLKVILQSEMIIYLILKSMVNNNCRHFGITNQLLRD